MDTQDSSKGDGHQGEETAWDRERKLTSYIADKRSVSRLYKAL